jgi:hypothetical protein
VREVSDLLPLGRANVREDLAKAEGEHLYLRVAATYKLQNALEAAQEYPPGKSIPQDDFSLITAATSQYAKTGVCHAYAVSATALHAAKLAGMQDERAIVAHSNRSDIDHVWSEMMPRGKGTDGKPLLHGEDVIMDGWCEENLAVLREDSHFARLDQDGNGNHLEHGFLLDHRSGPTALDRMEKFKAQIEESVPLQRTFHDDLERGIARGAEPDDDCLWHAQSVFHEGFRRQAGVALHKDTGIPAPGTGASVPDADPVSIRAKRASLAEIRAVGVARSLNSNIRGAVAEAPGMIASAREMFPKPLSRKRKRESA